MNDNVPSLDIEYIFYRIYRAFIEMDSFSAPFHFDVLWSRFQVVSFVFSVLCFAGIIYIIMRIRRIRIAEREELYRGMGKTTFGTSMEERKNEKWEHILELANSLNPRDWQFAILEADIILDTMVTRMGYRGDTLGEKLKSIEQSDFTTLNEAWEAHKVRNAIAHQGSDLILTARETRRVVDLYKAVFEEFHYI